MYICKVYASHAEIAEYVQSAHIGCRKR